MVAGLLVHKTGVSWGFVNFQLSVEQCKRKKKKERKKREKSLYSKFPGSQSIELLIQDQTA